MTIYIGVIPGETGAIALLSKGNKDVESQVCSYGDQCKVFESIRSVFKYDDFVVAIERLEPWCLAYSYWEGAFDMVDIRYKCIQPHVWQIVLCSMQSNKITNDSIIKIAIALFPWVQEYITINEASALLLAYYMQIKERERAC